VRILPAIRSLDELSLWAVSAGATSFLTDLEPYTWVRVAGVVERLRIDPAECGIEATVADGTATVAARWRLRRPTPQLSIAPGRGVLLEGISVMTEDGSPVLVEPAFEIVPLRRGG
jgi:hypothetical protein